MVGPVGDGTGVVYVGVEDLLIDESVPRDDVIATDSPSGHLGLRHA
jgi:hypothetical protein